jgi:hypothetical protein
MHRLLAAFLFSALMGLPAHAENWLAAHKTLYQSQEVGVGRQ